MQFFYLRKVTLVQDADLVEQIGNRLKINPFFQKISIELEHNKMVGMACGRNCMQFTGPDEEKITGLQRIDGSVDLISDIVILCKDNFNLVVPVLPEIRREAGNRNIVNIAVSEVIVFKKRSGIVFHKIV